MTHIDEHKLWDYLTGDLDANRAKQVEAHLNTCPTCQQKFNTELQFHNALFQLEDDMPSPNFSHKVIQTLERDLQLEKRLQFWLRFGKIAVINALIIAVVLPLLMLIFQKVQLPAESQLPNKVVLLLLSTCMVLWLLYALDLFLKRHFNKNMH